MSCPLNSSGTFTNCFGRVRVRKRISTSLVIILIEVIGRCWDYGGGVGGGGGGGGVGGGGGGGGRDSCIIIVELFLVVAVVITLINFCCFIDKNSRFETLIYVEKKMHEIMFKFYKCIEKPFFLPSLEAGFPTTPAVGNGSSGCVEERRGGVDERRSGSVERWPGVGWLVDIGLEEEGPAGGSSAAVDLCADDFFKNLGALKLFPTLEPESSCTFLGWGIQPVRSYKKKTY